MKFGNITIGKQLFVGWGKPKALGKGEEQIRGAAYVEGPVQIGKDDDFEEVEATLMVGNENNTDIEEDNHPTNAIKAIGDVDIQGNTNQNGFTTQTGTCTAPNYVGDISTTSGTPPGCKLFDIKHPTKEGHRLAHACIEGPEVAVYTRGRVCNGHNVIELPEYWRGLINYESLTIQLTAIHSHQNVIVKRISPIEGRIYLQAQGGMPVDCFYHIMAERVDVEKLIVEYEGKTPADYPGDNSGYSIAGYNYDVRS